MKLCVLTILFAIEFCYFTTASHGYECDKSATLCETSLNIDYRLTMYHSDHNIGKTYPKNGKLYKHSVTNTTGVDAIPTGSVISADGWENPRLVVVANDTMPGPPIVVYEGQKVKIHVKNAMFADIVSIHWHGIRQKGTPWMDGAVFVTQCPILPGHTFTYEFTVDRAGTYMYHSHVRQQRSRGLIGPFIVRKRDESYEEHTLMIQSWNHNHEAEVDAMEALHGRYIGRTPAKFPVDISNILYLNFEVHSVLVNGRGRFYDPKTNQQNEAPITIVHVNQSTQYRFRLVGSQALFPYRVSVDGHNLTVIATDGYDVEPTEVESVYISPGERFDVLIQTDKPIGNYWVRVQAATIDPNYLGFAILRYEGADDNEPTSSKEDCVGSVCKVLNCPFRFFPSDMNTECLPVSSLKAVSTIPQAPKQTDGPFKEFFFNFGVPAPPYASVNGRIFELPKVSALTQPMEVENTCDTAICKNNPVCHCVHSIAVDLGDVVQLVFVNHAGGPPVHHPIHVHGYSFHVVKTGFGTYNETTGAFINPNSDIECDSPHFCNMPSWRNASWSKDDLPGINLDTAPVKDTIFVPYGGYAVVRFKVDNPGVWSIHCHIDIDARLGMGFLLNSSFSHQPAAPKGFPTCREQSSNFGRDSIVQTTTTSTEGTTETVCKDMEDGYTMKTFWIVVAVLGLLMLFMAAYITVLRDKINKLKPKDQNYKI